MERCEMMGIPERRNNVCKGIYRLLSSLVWLKCQGSQYPLIHILDCFSQNSTPAMICLSLSLSLSLLYGIGSPDCGIVGAGESEICKARRQSRNSVESWCCNIDPKSAAGFLCCGLDAKLLLPWETSVFSLKVFKWLNEAHPHYGEKNLSIGYIVYWLQILITSKNCLHSNI